MFSSFQRLLVEPLRPVACIIVTDNEHRRSFLFDERKMHGLRQLSERRQTLCILAITEDLPRGRSVSVLMPVGCSLWTGSRDHCRWWQSCIVNILCLCWSVIGPSRSKRNFGCGVQRNCRWNPDFEFLWLVGSCCPVWMISVPFDPP